MENIPKPPFLKDIMAARKGVRRTNFRVSSGKEFKFPFDICICVLRKNLDLTQIHDEALINIKKTNRTTHVQMSNR